MEDPGQKLKRARERLELRYREVEEASQKIAEQYKNDEFVVALSRLSDIENRGTIPSLYRLYSLCAIYRLDIREVLDWYGIDLSKLGRDSRAARPGRTHLVNFRADSDAECAVPLALDPGFDLSRTTFLSRMVQQWGRIPLMLLGGVDPKGRRYGYIGANDWTMHPLLQPGSLVLIDDRVRSVRSSGWATEFERPIYMIEHRDGFACGWCAECDNCLMLIPHPSSQAEVRMFPRDEVDLIGQVIGVAMTLGQAPPRRSQA